MNVSLRQLSVPLRVPHHAAHGAVEHRELVLLALHDPDTGVSGFGEAAPLASYDGVSGEQVLDALRGCAGVLRAVGLRPGELRRAERADVLARCAELTTIPQALAAVDLALWDLAGKLAGRPVHALLGGAGEQPPAVEVNATVAAPDRAGAARAAAAAAAAGFRALKLKVGAGDDAGRVAAVRAAAGPGMRLRLDANGAWTVGEAVRWLELLAPAGIELCEEPVHGLDELEAVRAASPVPIALDESARLPGALDRRVADAVCLKLGACGGVDGLVSAARRARAAGYEVYLASTLDGPLGIAGALHAAAAIGPARACGLATLPLFDGRQDPLPAVAGRIQVPPGPGLGAGLAAWYA